MPLPRPHAPLLALLALLAALALGAGCGGSAGEAEPGERTTEAAKPSRGAFEYDRAAPLDVRERQGVTQQGFDVRDVSFARPGGGRARAFVVVPPGKGRHPAVLYLHGDGGDRLDFLGEAAKLSSLGAVTLALEAPYAKARGKRLSPGIAGLRQFARVSEQSVVEVRRAIDLLVARRDVDPGRIGLVGWSAGARTAAIAAGVDERVDAAVLLAAGAAPVSAYVANAPPDLQAEVERVMSRVDPLRYVADAAPARLLFQAGRQDRVVPREATLTLYRAASRPKELRWYAEMAHSPSERAYADARTWLAGRLGLGSG